METRKLEYVRYVRSNNNEHHFIMRYVGDPDHMATTHLAVKTDKALRWLNTYNQHMAIEKFTNGRYGFMIWFVPNPLGDLAEYTPIAVLHRDDFKAIGYDGSNLTDEQMERIASDMGDSYVTYGGDYWSDLESWAEEFNLPICESDKL